MSSDARAPLVYLIDIETSPNLGYTWGKYEQTVIRYASEWQLLSIAYKELGKGKTHYIARPDFKDKTDKSLAKAAWKILDEADVIIAHNGDRFDIRKLRAKFIEHGMAPPSPIKSIDTRKIARSQFMFNSNSLNDLAFTLKLGKKMQTGGFDLWLGCMAGDAKAWRKMIAYNKQDVILLEKVYQRLKSWYPNHPNLALYADVPGCPVCSSTNVQRRGYNVMKMRKNMRPHCQSCSHWFSRGVAA